MARTNVEICVSNALIAMEPISAPNGGGDNPVRRGSHVALRQLPRCVAELSRI
jgi:hypothetical protein